MAPSGSPARGAIRAGARDLAGSTHCPGPLRPVSVGPRFQTTLQGDLSSIRWPAVLSSAPGHLGHMPETLWGRPALPGDSGPGRNSHGVDQMSRATRARPDCLWGRPAVQGDSRFGLIVRRVDQLSRANRTRVRGPVVSTSSPGLIALLSDGLRGQPDVPGDLGSGPKCRGVHQLSRTTQPGSEGLCGRPVFPGTSGPDLTYHAVDQSPRATQASA